ncbi:hypothetical protein AVEN_79634-1 [Araneus ventricosus]|uniref:Uncharacterized protein n=1 Tax=Araneus ventricosus TaxID=182803 RepID=A0A4Y2G487_ARAVE|nr:hypothetical protein AVEN_79634-1 [Araneus ventricosus]
MDLRNVLACMVIAPWVWILTKFILFADHFDLIPLIIFRYLLVLLNRAIQKENLDVLKTVKDELQIKRDEFNQTEDHQCEEKCTQKVHGTNNASTQVEKIQFLEKLTQATAIETDAFT